MLYLYLRLAILVLMSVPFAAAETKAQPSPQADADENPAFCVLDRVSNIAPSTLFEECSAISEAEFGKRLCMAPTWAAFRAGLNKGMASGAKSVDALDDELSECRNDLEVATRYMLDDRDAERRLDKVRDCLAEAKQYAFNPSMNASLSRQVTECASLIE